MTRSLLLAATAAVAAASATTGGTPPDPKFPGTAAERVKKIVVVMLENRSFDHMLGWLTRLDPRVDGLRGGERNPWVVGDASRGYVTVTDDASDVDPDPSHSIHGTTKQIFGQDPRPAGAVASMDGFVASMAAHRGAKAAPDVMRMFNASSAPVLSQLSMEYALFDRWYASVPGPTEVNRAYLHSCTSHGMSHNDVATLVRGLPQRTIYDQLYDNQIDYRIFASDFSTVLFFARMRALHQLDKYRLMEDFYKHAHDGTLPPFSMVEPRYFTLPGIPANDMHPSHSVAEGEAFVRDIYNALRSSPTWNETALVITYDEHGGFYDHVPPPEAGVPNPDGINSTDPAIPFAFDRLGVRVPTIVVSPWVARGRLVGEPRESHFDHTSLAATLRKMWKLSGGPLTRRDAWAATFEGIFEELDAARPDSDCPGALAAPEIPRAMLEIETWRDGSLPLNDLQEGMLEFTAMLVGDKAPGDMSKWTEGKAASYIIDATRTWLSKLLGQSN